MHYLDNSATTKPCDAAADAALLMMREHWHNPSALYRPAIDVERAIDDVRGVIAREVGASPTDVIFTGGGTEADSLALLGTAARFRGRCRVLLFAAEHSAVLKTEAQLHDMGHDVSLIPADSSGVIDLDALDAALDESVALVSCMHVNNETGAVQPIEAVGQLIRSKSPGTLFHVDGVQGFLRLPFRLRQMGVDLYSISAHKVHGLKGTGALIAREGIRLAPRVVGGGQEHGLRSGTENTAGIAAFGAAVTWAASQKDIAERLLAMKLQLYSLLRSDIDGLRVNGPDPEGSQSAPHILNVSLPGVGGEVMLHALEAEGVLVGTGAACSSKKRAMSPAFAAMNAPRWAAENAIRFSLGFFSTPRDIDAAAAAVLRCHARYKVSKRR